MKRSSQVVHTSSTMSIQTTNSLATGSVGDTDACAETGDLGPTAHMRIGEGS